LPVAIHQKIQTQTVSVEMLCKYLIAKKTAPKMLIISDKESSTNLAVAVT